MITLYCIRINGKLEPVVKQTESSLEIVNPLVLLIPNHIIIETIGEIQLEISNIKDLKILLSEQTLKQSKHD